MLSQTGSGADRFYVMALEDVNPGTKYCWYDAAIDDGGKLDNIVSETTNDFRQGKTNTEKVMAKWEAEEWGTQDDNGTYRDMWGVIKDQVNEEWFVPSKSEWAAFGGELGITTNYTDYGLRNNYWSSSQYSTNRANYTIFDVGLMGRFVVSNGAYVRLSTTF